MIAAPSYTFDWELLSETIYSQVQKRKKLSKPVETKRTLKMYADAHLRARCSKRKMNPAVKRSVEHKHLIGAQDVTFYAYEFFGQVSQGDKVVLALSQFVLHVAMKFGTTSGQHLATSLAACMRAQRR